MIRKTLAALAAAFLILAGFAAPAAADGGFQPRLTVGKPTHIGSHGGAGLVCPPEGCYYYAGAQQSAISPAVTEVAGDMTIDDPWISTCCAYHTLTELTLQNSVSPIDDIIEWGWTRDNTGVYADTKPRLFASIFVDGVWQGYNVGFTDNASNAINLGSDLTPYLNTEKRFGITFVPAAGATPARWWLYFDTAYVAYVPAASIPGLNAGGTVVQAFGEVDAKDDHPCSDMGSNPAVLATGTTGARFANTTYNGAVTNVNLLPLVTNSAWYNATMQTGGTPSPSKRTVRFGGPGSC